MSKIKQKGQLEVGGLSGRHKILIICLLAVIVLAVIGHFLFRPDRNASLKIIYTGDLQGQTDYSPGKYAGYEKVGALAAKVSREGDYVLLLDAGNCLGGSETAEIDDGHSVITLMNAVGYDAMVPGTMDFIYGADTLSSLRAEAGFPFLAANIKKTDGSNAFENYKILNINSVRIGIVGVSLGLSQAQASKDSLTVEDPVEAVEEVIQQLYGKADAIIVLAYTGSEAVTESLASIDGVSMVIESGGSEAYSRITDDGTLIACAGRYGSVIGMAGLDISSDGAKIENSFYKSAMYDTLASDDSVVRTLESVSREKLSAEAMQVGSVYLETEEPDTAEESDTADSNEPETVSETVDTEAVDEPILNHITETGIGNLTADAMLDAASGDGAVIAWIRDRSIQGTLSNGVVSRGQIDALFEDNMYLVTCKMTGGEIRSALEDSFDNYPQAKDFLQVSGMTYTYDASRGIGSNLSDIMVGGHGLDDARTYVVAMTNSLADELGYSSETSGRISSYRTLASILSSYIQKQSKMDAQESDTGETVDDGTASDETVSEIEKTKRINIVE